VWVNIITNCNYNSEEEEEKHECVVYELRVGALGSLQIADRKKSFKQLVCAVMGWLGLWLYNSLFYSLLFSSLLTKFCSAQSST